MKTTKEILSDKRARIISVTVGATIYEAVKVMLAHDIGAILVKDGGRYVGIWTERDLLRGIVARDLDPKTEKIGDHMVTDLKSAPHTDTIYQILDKLLGQRIRHLLIEEDGEYIGLLSKRDVTRAVLVEKSLEYEKLNQLVSWEYYEDWKWKKNKTK